jgi:hypothetical protein
VEKVSFSSEGALKKAPFEFIDCLKDFIDENSFQS